ncbi:hypothetical protein [Thermotalea metallivorans]|uniref:Uncharacterized protein n=1 Tax=Thermotalea metallivorans TaxID=520762 RepID=A0A140KZ84_9FIRM|nr:hypothetical protein [Thermotalea metallivorans]KXG73609.1 hypothetical protein AN619_30550 [Thermotalea metallivorans]
MKKKTIGILLIIIFAVSIGFSYATKIRDNYIKDIRNSTGLIQLENDKAEKAKIRVNKVWEELESSYSIDTENYIQTGPGCLDILKEYFEPEQAFTIADDVISPYLKELPLGSILPLIYVKKDGTEVIFMYKEADGTNVLKKSILENKQWIRKEVKKEKGTPLEPIK